MILGFLTKYRDYHARVHTGPGGDTSTSYIMAIPFFVATVGRSPAELGVGCEKKADRGVRVDDGRGQCDRACPGYDKEQLAYRGLGHEATDPLPKTDTRLHWVLVALLDFS